MIQRIQSIFLLLAALVFGSLFMVPFAISNEPGPMFLADGDYDIMDHPVLLGLTVVGVLVSLISIFLFRKRPVQLKLGYLIIVVAILLPIIAFLLFTNASAGASADLLVQDQVGIFLPALAILFSAIANYFIKKDDKLVKSMDRLR